MMLIIAKRSLSSKHCTRTFLVTTIVPTRLAKQQRVQKGHLINTAWPAEAGVPRAAYIHCAIHTVMIRQKRMPKRNPAVRSPINKPYSDLSYSTDVLHATHSIPSRQPLTPDLSPGSSVLTGFSFSHENSIPFPGISSNHKSQLIADRRNSTQGNLSQHVA